MERKGALKMEGKGKRLAATACAFTLLFCMAVGLGVHGAFQYQEVKQERHLSAGNSLKQAQKEEAAQPSHQREPAKSTAAPETKPVSYTHLDVYKRQIHAGSSINGRVSCTTYTIS